jgi:hypothetical protein
VSVIRDRLARLERLVGEKLACPCEGATAIRVVGTGEKLKDADRPLPCSRCGAVPTLLIVECSIAVRGDPGSGAKAAHEEIGTVGPLRIDEPDPGKAVGPPAPGVN